MTDKLVQIVSFYEFMELGKVRDLADIRGDLRSLFLSLDIRGTIILAPEGYNGMVCSSADSVREFLALAGEILCTTISARSSFHSQAPFRKIDIKIKPEIVTFKRSVEMSLGRGTYVRPEDWNDLISDPEVVVLDTRNDYEFRTGTFRNSINPETQMFSQLPDFVERFLDRVKHKKIATFCTGGIRCEKFVPYLKGLGFEEVFQLDGGILRYLEEVPVDEQLWDGECFVFDERITVGPELQKGTAKDLSQRVHNRKRSEYLVD